ncbi:MAG TPA: hypothetical protein ENN67_05530 [Firmicutes bacterium]|nr:hypothetical protein [Bacillota bacterium]
MYHLATVFPIIRKVRIPVSRDQAMLIMAAINLIFLGIDIYLAHSISRTIVPNEWIPIIFGPIAGALVLFMILISLRWKNFSSIVLTIIFMLSIAVGLLGFYFHIMRGLAPSGPPGEQVSIPLLVWAPPFVAPLTFSLVGLWGIASAWKEHPPESGTLQLIGKARFRFPISKSRAFFFMVGLGILACVVSAVLDHARAGFQIRWLWFPVITGLFGMVSALSLGFISKPKHSDLVIFVIAMCLLILTGVLGSYFHFDSILTPQGLFVMERFIRGAPFLAPLLFADMGGLGLVMMMNADDEHPG